MSLGTNSKPNATGTPAGLSKETQALLNDVMSKRGLSKRAMQDVTDSMQRGDGKWADHISTSTAAFKPPASKTQATVNVPKFSGQARMPPAMPPASFSGMRMAPDIVKGSRDMFTGGAPGLNRDAEKDRLSQLMEHGAKKVKELEQQRQRMLDEAARPARKVDTREEMINQVVAEVQERREFLEAMQAAGKASQYEATIKGEIAQRLKELERLGLDVKSSRPQQGVDPAKLRLG